MACSDLDPPDVGPAASDWIRWIRLASARPVRPGRDETAPPPAPRLFPMVRIAGGPKLR